MGILEFIADYHWLIGLVGGGGLVALAIAFPAAEVAALGVAKFILRYRFTVALAAALLAGTSAYLAGIRTEQHRNEARDAKAQAAFALKLATASRIAATHDQARAAAADAARAIAEKRANDLARQVPTTACFAPADVDKLRGLWGAPAPARRAAGPAAAIAELLHRGRTAAETRANH